MTTVRFTAGSLGLISPEDPYKFARETASAGEEGELVEPADYPVSVPEGWVLVKVGDLYAPVHPSMIEPVE